MGGFGMKTMKRMLLALLLALGPACAQAASILWVSVDPDASVQVKDPDGAILEESLLRNFRLDGRPVNAAKVSASDGIGSTSYLLIAYDDLVGSVVADDPESNTIDLSELSGSSGGSGSGAGAEYVAVSLRDLIQTADLASTTIKLELGKEPGMTGPIKTATSVADALTFQFYEMADEKAAAFGHDLTRDDWLKIHSIVDTYTWMLFETPLISVNEAHPLLPEIRSELTAEGRKFTFLCGHDSNVASVLSALGVEEYTLPDTVEPRTPIGVKLVFEKWSSEDGESYARVRLVYQSTEQLRGIIPLSLDNPPMSFDIDLPGLERNADGYYRTDDVLESLRKAIDAYDALVEKYGGEEARMDDAA